MGKEAYRLGGISGVVSALGHVLMDREQWVKRVSFGSISGVVNALGHVLMDREQWVKGVSLLNLFLT